MLSAPDGVAAAARQFRRPMVLQAKTRQRQLGDHLGKQRASVNHMQHGARLLPSGWRARRRRWRGSGGTRRRKSRRVHVLALRVARRAAATMQAGCAARHHRR